VDVYTSWCGWCKKLDKDTYGDPTVKQFLNASFVGVKCDAEDGGAGQRLASEHGVNGYPTTMVFTPDGKLIGMISEYLAPKEFISQVTEIMHNK
jgi:uncharacterized protein YyaL (SSP411 family)